MIPKRYEVMDECLNYIWNLIKNDTDENAYQKILEEQRTWIADKKQKQRLLRMSMGMEVLEQQLIMISQQNLP